MSMVSRKELDDAKRLVGPGAPSICLHKYLTSHIMIVNGYTRHPQRSAMLRAVSKAVTEYLQEDEDGNVVIKPTTAKATVVSWMGVKVLTADKLARLFRVDEATLRTLFAGNRDWFRENVDFFQLTEKDLTKLRNSGSQSVGGKKAMLLWTESGAGQMSRLIQHKVLGDDSAPVEDVPALPVAIVEAQENNNVLPVLEWDGVRVVTTATLARGYRSEPKSIHMNLSRHATRFTLGVHYFHLTNSDLKKFKDNTTGGGVVDKRAKQLYLWTEKGAARMSKIVDTDQAWSFFEKLEDAYFRSVARQSPQSIQPVIPQTLSEALRLAADLADEKEHLVHQLEAAAPKVEFADLIEQAPGVLIGNFAKVLGLGQNKLFAWLRDKGVIIESGERKNMPKQRFIEGGYFTVGEKPVRTEHGFKISFTTRITGKGQQWLTRKLLEDGLIKAVAAN